MKRIASFLLAILAFATWARADGETAYALWCADNTTLYFAYRAETLEPVTQVVSLATQSFMLQGSNTIPVNPGAEGNQEGAEVKGGPYEDVRFRNFL